MELSNLSPIRIASLGVLYGALLGLLAFFAAGGGHGTYVFVGVSSAPLGILGIPVGLLGAPAVWGTLGWLLGRAFKGRRNAAFLTVAAVHYLGGAALLMTPTYGDFGYLRPVISAMPIVVLTWVTAYLGGQIGLWLLFRVVKRDVRPG